MGEDFYLFSIYVKHLKKATESFPYNYPDLKCCFSDFCGAQRYGFPKQDRPSAPTLSLSQ
jgi:hypothetical protein